MKPPPHGSSLRVGRVSLDGQIYAITTVTLGRQPIFADFFAARTVAHVLYEQAGLGRADTLAHVVMPDHLHWLLQLHPGQDLSRLVGGAKQRVSRKLGLPVWQDGFHDHALRQEEDVRAWARYIVANPIRAGLVRRAGDYPHWDAIWLQGEY